MISYKRKREAIRSLGNVMIKGGKKGQALNVLYGIMGGMKSRKFMNPIDAFNILMENISPILSVRPYKRGGRIIRIPFKVYPGYANFLGLQMMRANARRRIEYNVFKQYKAEAVDSFVDQSVTSKQIQKLHMEALTNRIFLRMRRKGGIRR